MYANIPCALGLQGYAEIAETAGDAEAARSMRETAASLRKAITDVLSKDGQWLMSEFGYYHDCALTFLSDLCGYDINDMPPEWVQLSKNTYEADISRSRHIPYDASGGLGYNTSMQPAKRAAAGSNGGLPPLCRGSALPVLCARTFLNHI